jgi:hypothetical protein
VQITDKHWKRRAADVEYHKYMVIDGYVSCSRHGEVHEDDLDPYDYGPPTAGYYDQRCSPEDHEPVYTRVKV